MSVPLSQLDDKRKNKDSEKRSRLDREKVQDMLFAAFEKHQYYNVKDLVGITKQPIVSTGLVEKKERERERECVCVLFAVL